MRLKQIEFCHNCNKDVEFEFDDVTERQVIICPNCGHEHWRELDEGTITQIRLHPGAQVVYMCQPTEIMDLFSTEGSIINESPIKVECKRVLGTDENGYAIIEGNGRKTISQRRWGRDRRQEA